MVDLQSRLLWDVLVRPCPCLVTGGCGRTLMDQLVVHHLVGMIESSHAMGRRVVACHKCRSVLLQDQRAVRCHLVRSLLSFLFRSVLDWVHGESRIVDCCKLVNEGLTRLDRGGLREVRSRGWKH